MNALPPSPANAPAQRRLLLGSTAASLLVAALLLATWPGLPMVWDEGNAILRAERIGRGEWLYTNQVEGHPALYGMVIFAGHRLAEGWLPPLTAWRFGPVLLFALAAGAMFYRVEREWSLRAAVGAVAAMVLLPRLFAHAHFASFDGPLLSCWVLAWAAFAWARRSWWGTLAWGVALGMTLSCKATGWIAPLPFLAWAAIHRDRPAAAALALGVPVALFTFFLLNPPLWTDPIQGTAAFFQLNFTRAANPGLNISTSFLGEMYNLDHPLPWYNTLWWTAITVPSGILLLAILGVGVACRRRRSQPAGTLLVLNWAVLLVVRALPGVPPHDGVRLFLPAFAFLAVLAGVGCDAALAWAGRRWPGSLGPRVAAGAGVVLLYATGAAGLVMYHPQWLSYYNGLVGGLPGATALGMEPTYYWDGLDGSVLDWLHQNTGEDEGIRFGTGSPENRYLMRRWEILNRETAGPLAPGRFRWYVFQRRPSGYLPADEWLIEHAEPAFRKTLLGVPLVEVYAESDYQRARAAVGDTW